MDKSVRYLLRKNLGNYEHHELEITDVIESGKDGKSVVSNLMSFVKSALAGEFSEKTTTTPAEKPVAERVEKPKAEKPAPVETKTEEKGEVTKPVEKPREEIKKEEPKKEEAKKAPAETKKTARGASKNTKYDNAFDPHKKLLGAFLDANVPGWKKADVLEKCKATSKDMVGQDFLDADGEVMESFKKSFLEALSSK